MTDLWGSWNNRPKYGRERVEGLQALVRETQDLMAQIARERDAANARAEKADAVIEKVREAWEAHTDWLTFGVAVQAALHAAPSAVLAEHDARTWDDATTVALDWALGKSDGPLPPNPHRADGEVTDGQG